MDESRLLDQQLDWCVEMLQVLRSTSSLTSAWPPPASGATYDHPSSSARGQQKSVRGQRSPDVITQHAVSQLTDRGIMQGSNSAPNFQHCVDKDKSNAMHSSESSAPYSGYQGMARSATSWTSGSTKSSPVAVVRPHELPRKNRHWSVVSPVARSVRQQPFEPTRFDGAPHSRQTDCYVSSDSHLSPHTKHSTDYQNIRHVDHPGVGGSPHTGGDISYDGQFAASGKTPSPPLPPVRDGSSLRYTRIGQTHEKYPSWPVTAASQNESSCSSCRTNSWSEPTTTISSGEFAMKPNKMVYQPQLKHIDEKVTSESLRRHLEENGVKSQKQMVTGDVLEAVAAHMTSDTHMKDFQMARTYPRYDHEGVLHDSKDYTVPSPPERDISVFTATSCEPSRQWSKDTRTSPLWDASRHPEYPTNVRTMSEDGRGRESSPPNRSTSTDTFISPLTSPTTLPPEILGSRNVSVKYVMRSSKPYYNTGTQTDDLDTGDVPLHHRKSPMSVVNPMPSSDRPSMKEASTSPPPESFYDNAKVADDRRSSRYQRDSEQQTAMDHVDVSARSKTLTTPMQYTAPSAIGATARNTSTALQHSSPVSGPARNPSPADRTSMSNDYRGTSSQWSPEADTASQLSPQDDFLAQIHEHSPSQTQMLRKLSQEFYGTRSQQQRSGFTFNQPHKKEPLPSPGNTHKGIAPVRESFADSNDVADAARAGVGPASDSDPKSWERLQNMSLRKAYGTYDDPSHPSENPQKLSHYRSVSTSQVPQVTKQKTASLPQGHKGQSSLDSSSKITRRVKDFVGSLLGGTKNVDTRKIAEEARRDWEQRDMPRKVGTPSKLKRTTSEQIRPMKDRSKEKPRLKDVYARRSGDDSDPASMSYRTSSDLNRFQVTKHAHRTSDPTEASEAQKHVSVDSDVFVDCPSLRPASTRSTASTGSAEDRRNSSDPQLKKLQQQAVVSFFEVKTGKRMSSSSVESTGGEQPQPPPPTHWPVSPPTEDARKEAMKKSMSHDALQSFPRHGRSSSGSILREAEKMFPVADTSFEESMSPPLLDIPVGDRSGMSLSPVSSVSSPTMQQEYSPPLHPWGEDAEYRSSSQSLVFPRKTDADRLTADYSDKLKDISDPETHPKALYEYAASSFPPPMKSTSESPQTFTHHMTTRPPSSPEDEPDDSSPPTLPPRNYRQKHDGGTRHSAPPPTPGGDAAKSEHRSWIGDSPPKADSYADQVRQQAYRLSQSHSNLLGAGRHPSKTDLKTGVSTSRPVDKPPTVQEALGPLPYCHSAETERDPSVSPGYSHSFGLQTAASNNASFTDDDGGLSPGPANSSVFVDGNSPLPAPSAGGFHAMDTNRLEIDERPVLPGNSYHREPYHFRKSSSGNQPSRTTHDLDISLPGQIRHDLDVSLPGQIRHDLVDDAHVVSSRKTSSASVLSCDVDQSLTMPESRAEPPWLTGHKVGNPSHRVRSMSPERGALSVSEPEPERDTEEKRLSVHTLLSNYEKKKGLSSVSLHGTRSTDAASAMTSSSENLSSVTHTKVTQLRETLLRRSNENLLQSDYHDGALNISSDTTPPSERRESTGSVTMVSQRHHSPCGSPKPWRDTNVSDVSAFTHTCKPAGITDSSLEIAMAVTSSKSSATTATNPQNSITTPTPTCRDDSVTTASGVTRKSFESLNPRKSVESLNPRKSVESLNSRKSVESLNSRKSVESLNSRKSVESLNTRKSIESLNSRKSVESLNSRKSVESLTSSLGDVSGAKSDSNSSGDVSSQTDGKSAIVPQHHRHKSLEEHECDRHAAVLVQQLSRLDKHLCNIILPSPELKMTTDYMAGIFDTSVDLSRRPSILERNGSRPEVRKRSCGAMEDKGNKSCSPLPASSPYWSPPSVAQLQNKIREEGHKIDDLLKGVGGADTSLQDQKTELMCRIEKKLEILVEEKRLLDEEIAENVMLGDELTAIVSAKVDTKAEFDKYQLYVNELGKVMKLLLQLSGRLARANNAINAMMDGDDKEKVALTQKRDELSEKHDDAKQLKEGIDRRSHQVATFLRRHLQADEFTDYEHFIKMKCKLMIEQQEIEDKIKLGREQLAALQESIAESNA